MEESIEELAERAAGQETPGETPGVEVEGEPGEGAASDGGEMMTLPPEQEVEVEGDPDSQLSVTQVRAVAALLEQATVPMAAKAAGVNVVTVYRWLKDPVFSREYRRSKRHVFEQAVTSAGKYAPLAVHVLASVMADQTAGARARVIASVALLKLAREGMEIDDLLAQVESLTERVEQCERRISE